MTVSRVQLVAPLTAAALIAQQVGSNAIRDGLFLSWFPVTSLPYFIAGCGHPRHPRRAVVRPAPRPVRPGPRRSCVLGRAGSCSSRNGRCSAGSHEPRRSSSTFTPPSWARSPSRPSGRSSTSGSIPTRRSRSWRRWPRPRPSAVSWAASAPSERRRFSRRARCSSCWDWPAAPAPSGPSPWDAGCRPGAAPKGPEDASSGWAEIRRTPLLRDLALVIALAAAARARSSTTS